MKLLSSKTNTWNVGSKQKTMKFLQTCTHFAPNIVDMHLQIPWIARDSSVEHFQIIEFPLNVNYAEFIDAWHQNGKLCEIHIERITSVCGWVHLFSSLFNICTIMKFHRGLITMVMISIIWRYGRYVSHNRGFPNWAHALTWVHGDNTSVGIQTWNLDIHNRLWIFIYQ